MVKRTNKEILEYYRESKVVDSYHKKRFFKMGGDYIDEIETKSILKNITRTNVLEVGSGTGRLTRSLVKKTKSVTCLDSSPKMLRLLKKDLKDVKIINQSIFVPIKTLNKFEAVTSLRFFDHFSLRDQDKIIKNILPNLTSKGIFIYSTLNKNSLESWLSSFFYYSKTNYFYTYDDYIKLFKKNRLKIEKFESKFFFPRGLYLRLGNSRTLLKLLALVDNYILKNFNGLGALYTFQLRK